MENKSFAQPTITPMGDRHFVLSGVTDKTRDRVYRALDEVEREQRAKLEMENCRPYCDYGTMDSEEVR